MPITTHATFANVHNSWKDWKIAIDWVIALHCRILLNSLSVPDVY